MALFRPPKGALTRQATNLQHVLYWCRTKVFRRTSPQTSRHMLFGAAQRRSDARVRKPPPCALLVPNKSVPAHEPANLPSWHFSKPNQRYLHPQGGTAVQKLAIAKPRQVSPPAGGNGSIGMGQPAKAFAPGAARKPWSIPFGFCGKPSRKDASVRPHAIR